MPPVDQPISLYVHVPFCLTKCPYCDFNTYQGLERLIFPFVGAAVDEVGLWGETLRRPEVRTIFFGGGTPSYISASDLSRLLDATEQSFQITTEAEITVEANPGDLTLQKLEAWLAMGVNRLSIGVQSLDDTLLSLLGRRHTAEEALSAHRRAVEAGFRNISLDLMYGLPRQTMKQWQATLRQAAHLHPSHLSLYCLTLEDGTPMERSVSHGELPDPDPDLAADMYLFAEEALAERGYQHYEISNWCLPGYQSQHNTTYWRNQPYLGIGPGAHSCLNGFRFHNVKAPHTYIELVRDWAKRVPWQRGDICEEVLKSVSPVAGAELITHRTAMAETMYLGLRLLEGVSFQAFQSAHGQGLLDVYGEEISELRDQGLLETDEATIRLTPRGRLLANQVFVRFVGREN